MGQLTGRTALVAGAGRNNGRAISIAFAREGADLILVAREKKDSLNEVVKECESLGAKVLPVMGDVSDHQQVERLVQQGLDHFGQIERSHPETSGTHDQIDRTDAATHGVVAQPRARNRMRSERTSNFEVRTSKFGGVG